MGGKARDRRRERDAVAPRELVSERPRARGVSPARSRAPVHRPAATRSRMARDRARLRGLGPDGGHRAPLPDRRRARGRPLGRPAAPGGRARGGPDDVPPASAPGPAAPDTAHGRPAQRLLRPGRGGRARGVLVPVHRRGSGTRRHGAPSRRGGRCVLAPAGGPADGDHRASSATGHARGAGRGARARPTRGVAHLRPRARHAVPPPCPHATRRRLPRPVAGRHAHVGAGDAPRQRRERPPAGADGVPRLGCGVGLRRADPAGPLPHALGTGAARRSPPRPRARAARVDTGWRGAAAARLRRGVDPRASRNAVALARTRGPCRPRAADLGRAPGPPRPPAPHPPRRTPARSTAGASPDADATWRARRTRRGCPC